MRATSKIRRLILVLAVTSALQACAGQAGAEVEERLAAEKFADCSIYDSHAHLISDDLERYPRNPLPLESGSESATFKAGTVGQPGGMHGPNPVNEKPTAEQMYGWMAEEGVCGIAAVQKGMIYRTDNRYIIDAAKLFPDRMTAVIIIDPDEAGTLDLIRDAAKNGAVGIRFFGVGVEEKAEWMSSPASEEVWQLADELGLVVTIEGPASGRDELIPVVTAMADKFPDLPIVLDHVFMPDVTQPNFGIGANFEPLAARKNISVKFTALNMDVIREEGLAPEKVLRRTVDAFGPDRVMWGSDIGTSSGTYKEMVERAKASAALLSDQERRKYLREVGQGLFGAERG